MSTVGNVDTHMFECKAEVLGWKFHQPPPKQKSTGRSLEMFNAPKLWPGFTAKIRFPLRTNAAAAVIPEEAYRHTEKGYIVFVPEERKRADGKSDWVARARVIDIGIRGEGWVEVRRGLSVGERVVHRGAEALEDGTPIKINTN
jgi:multidrug efflux pump subunit AcrA (membrane-fusion protein)